MNAHITPFVFAILTFFLPMALTGTALQGGASKRNLTPPSGFLSATATGHSVFPYDQRVRTGRLRCGYGGTYRTRFRGVSRKSCLGKLIHTDWPPAISGYHGLPSRATQGTISA